MAASVHEYPSSSSTGVPAGLELRVLEGDFSTTSDGQIIDAVEIRGSLNILHDDVVVTRSRIVARTPYHVVRVYDKAQNIQFSGLRMEDCEIDGQGAVNGIAGSGRFRRLDVHHVNNGINCWGACDIEDCFLHDLSTGAEQDPHYDGIEINGGGQHRIVHNAILNHHAQTSAVMINNEFNRIGDILVERNLLVGGGYTIYVDWRKKGEAFVDAATINFVDNHLGKGVFGYTAFFGMAFPFIGNIDATSGQPIAAQ